MPLTYKQKDQLARIDAFIAGAQAYLSTNQTDVVALGLLAVSVDVSKALKELTKSLIKGE
jgi:hypothetical protein